MSALQLSGNICYTSYDMIRKERYACVYIKVKVFAQEGRKESFEVINFGFRKLELVTPIVSHPQEHLSEGIDIAAAVISAVNKVFFSLPTKC